MKLKIWLAAAVTAAFFTASADEVAPKDYFGHVANRLASNLMRHHVLQRQLDDEISQRAWTNLVTFYDTDHSIFLQSDLDRLSAHQRTIDDEIDNHDVSFGFEVHSLYIRRLRERIDFATNLLAKGDWDFSSNETYRIKRKDAPWPATRAEAEEHWRKRMKNEVLAIRIGHELDKSTNRIDVAGDLIKRYRQFVTVMSEPDEDSVLQHYLSAVSHAFDPHTDYMSPASKEDFDMELNLTLCGVGATLSQSMDDGALQIVEIIKGGPIDVDGRIREGDEITGVMQEGGEMEDVVWQPMKKSIHKIRGKKGTKVTLQIVPKGGASGGSKRLIELVRDEIRLEDEAATGRVENVVLNGYTNRVGYVYLPGFYASIDKRPGDDGYRCCSQDIEKYLADFNSSGVKGLVLDLRGNGGGILREAVLLSALFVPQGPVVQIRDLRSVVSLPIPPGNPIAFNKPMVVLIDRASASASEIVAGHLQDTGRAIVLGDRCTHGKGTVQTPMGLGPEKYGSCKITNGRFYRVNGRSTQLEGVPSDIVLPSLWDSLDVGEDKLSYALPFTEIAPADYMLCWNMHKYVRELKRLSEARQAKDQAYLRHLDNVKGMKEIADREEVSLEYQTRLRQMKSDRDLRETEDDDGDSDDEDGATEKKRRRKRNEPRKGDVVLDEAFRIMHDLIRLNKGSVVPEPRRSWWY